MVIETINILINFDLISFGKELVSWKKAVLW